MTSYKTLPSNKKILPQILLLYVLSILLVTVPMACLAKLQLAASNSARYFIPSDAANLLDMELTVHVGVLWIMHVTFTILSIVSHP